MSLRDEIFEQPTVLQRLLDTQWDTVRRVAEAIRQQAPAFAFLAARGTSDHAGVYAQYLWGAFNRLPLAFAAPSLFTRYDDIPRLGQALVVGVSQSGQSPDVVSVISAGRQQGAVTIAITNKPDSPLAQAAQFTLDLGAGEERAVAATKTYTAQLMMIALLSAAIREDSETAYATLKQVPDAVAEALKLDSEAERIAQARAAMTRCVVLGRGFSYADAHEWALKLKELSYVFADPYSPSDFQHGPIAIVEPGFPLLAIAPTGAVFADVLALLNRLRSDYSADLLVLSDSDEALALGNHALRLPSGLPEWVTPIVSIVPAQLFCYHLTRAKGYDTEAPRNIRKVTLTH